MCCSVSALSYRFLFVFIHVEHVKPGSVASSWCRPLKHAFCSLRHAVLVSQKGPVCNTKEALFSIQCPLFLTLHSFMVLFPRWRGCRPSIKDSFALWRSLVLMWCQTGASGNKLCVEGGVLSGSDLSCQNPCEASSWLLLFLFHLDLWDGVILSVLSVGQETSGRWFYGNV